MVLQKCHTCSGISWERVLQEYQHDKHDMLSFHGGGGTGDLFFWEDGGTANLCPQFQPVWFEPISPRAIHRTISTKKTVIIVSSDFLAKIPQKREKSVLEDISLMFPWWSVCLRVVWRAPFKFWFVRCICELWTRQPGNFDLWDVVLW